MNETNVNICSFQFVIHYCIQYDFCTCFFHLKSIRFKKMHFEFAIELYFQKTTQKHVSIKEETKNGFRSQKSCWENYANQITRDTLHRVGDNFMERVKICYQEDGGHFEHLLKKSWLYWNTLSNMPFFAFISFLQKFDIFNNDRIVRVKNCLVKKTRCIYIHICMCV